MSYDRIEILEKLERGDISSEQALEEMRVESHVDQDFFDHYLRVRVSGMKDSHPRVHIQIPLRMLKAGMDIGAAYAPELRDLDLQKIFRDLQSYAAGSILEVEDFEKDERILISIERAED
jgi:hypothetical protein